MPSPNPPDGGHKNPWGRPPGGGNGPRNPWGGGNGNGGGPAPDIDDLLRKAQDNLRQVMPHHMGPGRMILIGLAVIVGLWILSGFYIIEPGENGVVQRFGKLERTQTAEGLDYHLPWPVETINIVDVSHVRSLPIGYADRSQENEGVAPDTRDESLILTSDANIIDLDFVVLWNIKSAQDYLFSISNPENTIKKVAESAIREQIGQTPMLDIIISGQANGAGDLAEKVRTLMQQNLDSYKSGINITQVTIQKAEVHPDVQAAFQDVQSAKQDAKKAENQARTYTEDIVPRARGVATQRVLNAEAYREAAIARATGEAKRFNAMYDSYQQGRDVTRARLYLETMEDVLGHAQTTIIDSKGGTVLPYLPAVTGEKTAAEAPGKPAEMKP